MQNVTKRVYDSKMINDLENLVNLIESLSIVPVLTTISKGKIDKNLINMVFSELSPTFTITCIKCRTDNTWKDSASKGWKFNGKDLKYICNNCL